MRGETRRTTGARVPAWCSTGVRRWLSWLYRVAMRPGNWRIDCRVGARRWVSALGLLLVVLTHAVSLEGQEREEGALFLLLPVGGEGVGMARAMATGTGTSGAFWNPAGVAAIGERRVAIFRGDHIAGTLTGISALFGREDGRTLGVSYALLDSGSQDLTDDRGTVLGTISVRGHHGVVTAAVPFGSRVRIGANLKWVRFRQSCRGQCPDAGVMATAYATDLGAQVEPLNSHPLTIGVTLAHLGSPLRVRGSSQSNPLPLRLRVGGSYLLSWTLAEEEVRLRLITEIEDRPRDPGDPAILLASELQIGTQDRIYFRGGYIFGTRSQIDGAGIGFGLRYERFEFDLARSLARGGPAIEGEPMHFTLGFAL